MVVVTNSFAFVHLAIASTTDRVEESIATQSSTQLDIILIPLHIKTVHRLIRLHPYALSQNFIRSLIFTHSIIRVVSLSYTDSIVLFENLAT